MDIDRLQRWLSLCANIAIIGGIVFLAIEINQNTQVTISDASQEITNQSLEYFTRAIDSAVLARALYKQSAGQELDGLEFQQVWFHQYINFRLFENAYLQYLRGYFQESEWARYRRIIARRLSSDYVAAQLWQDTDSRGDWTSEFSEEVNDIVSTITLSNFQSDSESTDNLINIEKGPDVMEVSPDVYTVIFEDSDIRIMNFTLLPGESDKPHSHPSYMVFILEGSTLRVYETEEQFEVVSFDDGQKLILDPVNLHWAENIGNTTAQAVMIEYKY